jgi:hypothetical protein
MENRTLPIPLEQFIEGENWRPLPKYPDLYFVSDHGRCWSIEKQKVIKLWPDRHGYLQYSQKIPSLGHRVSFRIHREAALAFIPNPDNYPQVHHIDDNKLNNSLNNLRWGTHRMNQEDAERNKVEGYAHRCPVVGTHLKSGETREYPSLTDVSRDGFNISNVRQCCKGRRHKAHGYKWRYKDDAGEVQVSNISWDDKNTVT